MGDAAGCRVYVGRVRGGECVQDAPPFELIAARSWSTESTFSRSNSRRRPARSIGIRPASPSRISHLIGTPETLAMQCGGTNEGSSFMPLLRQHDCPFRSWLLHFFRPIRIYPDWSGFFCRCCRPCGRHGVFTSLAPPPGDDPIPSSTRTRVRDQGTEGAWLHRIFSRA